MNLLQYVIFRLISIRLFRFIDDERYLKFLYFTFYKRKLDIYRPQRFTEKMQWLKLNYKTDIDSIVADKYLIKTYINEQVGDDIAIPTLGVYEKVTQIDFDKLPNKFIVKPTHTSGNFYICDKKSKKSIKEMKRLINKWLKRDYYWYFRETQYKYVKNRIIIEPYLNDGINESLIDYKFYCFNGTPNFVQVISDRKNGHYYINNFDLNWKSIDVKQKKYIESDKVVQPVNFEKMISIASILSRKYPFTRVDLYNINGNIYFGEITLYPAGGFIFFESDNTDFDLGKMIDITENTR